MYTYMFALEEGGGRWCVAQCMVLSAEASTLEPDLELNGDFKECDSFWGLTGLRLSTLSLLGFPDLHVRQKVNGCKMHFISTIQPRRVNMN